MEHPPSFDDGRPTFDHSFARELLGKYVLIGITSLDHNEKLIEYKQFHGYIDKVDAREGMRVSLIGARKGEFEWLPPDTRVFHKARPGEYRLKSSAEVVVNPDYTAMWTHIAPGPKEQAS